MIKLPKDAKGRKATPVATGCLDYFPDALCAVAQLSQAANEQHNPGQPMHWAREKSMDHADCLVRHLLQRGTLDDDGQSHTVKVAWRALALLQIEIEEQAEEQPDTHTAREIQQLIIEGMEMAQDVERRRVWKSKDEDLTHVPKYCRFVNAGCTTLTYERKLPFDVLTEEERRTQKAFKMGLGVAPSTHSVEEIREKAARAERVFEQTVAAMRAIRDGEPVINPHLRSVPNASASV